MTKTPKLNLYRTRPHACSYLEGREASTLFVDPDLNVNPAIYSRLSERGFRRSGEHLYRPNCNHCNACIPLRVPVDGFLMTRQQKRCWKSNTDLSVVVSENISSGEHYALYERYINERHNDGDMYPADREQFESFLGSHWDVTHYIEFRHGHHLLAVAVSDILDNGLSAIYTFFDPEETKRSLGVYAVLFQIELAKRMELEYVYLGFWIQDSPKMSYKSNYRPFEIYQADEWQLVR